MPLYQAKRNDNGQSVFGSSYTITAAAGTYADTGFSITLPRSGTYLVYGNLRAALKISAGSIAWIATKLFNSTDSADVSNTVRLIVLTEVLNAEVQSSMGFSHIMSVTASKVIKLYAKRDGTGTPTYTTSSIYSDSEGYSNLGYIWLAP